MGCCGGQALPFQPPCPAHLTCPVYRPYPAHLPCPPIQPSSARGFAAWAFQAELSLPSAPKLGVPLESVLLEPFRNSPSFKETTGSHWEQHISPGQRSPAPWWRRWWWWGSLETPHLRGPSSAPPFPRAEAPSPFPWVPPGVCREANRGMDWPRLRADPTRFQEKPLAGRRQQGAGALVAG